MVRQLAVVGLSALLLSSAAGESNPADSKKAAQNQSQAEAKSAAPAEGAKPSPAKPSGREQDRELQIPAQLQRTLEKMDAEEQERFWSNLEKWEDMDSEERDYLRNRFQGFHDDIRKEAADALNKSGLKLDGDRREVFELRYFQERRTLERELRQKMEKEREDGRREIISELRKEFEPFARTNRPPEQRPQKSAAPAEKTQPKPAPANQKQQPADNKPAENPKN